MLYYSFRRNTARALPRREAFLYEACRAEGNRRAEFHTCERIEAQAVVRRYAVGELVEEAESRVGQEPPFSIGPKVRELSRH